jgi:predicted acylesterase/phospholipase RssA
MPSTDSLIAKPNQQGSKRALILAGGGVRLAYQAGVLQALEEKGLQFTHFDGTSGGIFNTAMLASGISPGEMASRWRKLKIKYFMSGMPVKSYLKPLSMMAFGDADGIREKVFPSLGIDLEKIRNNQEIVATFNVCNFSNKSIESIPHDQVTEDHLIAGVSLPIFMPAIKINDDWYSDAVWVKDANLMEAVRRGAEEIWLVWAIGNHREYLPGFFNQYVHMIEMSANGGLLEEYAQINHLNARIAKGDSPFGQKAPIKLHVIKPEYPLPLDPALFFNKIDANTLINMGYADTKKYLKDLSQEGVAYDTTSTHMQQPGTALSFRQCYEGRLDFKKEKTAVTYCPSFTLRKWGEKLAMEGCSSIYIAALGKEVCTHENEVRLRKKKKQQFIHLSSTFECDGQTYLLKAMISLGGVPDWWLGLEFKSVHLQISTMEHGKEVNIMEGNITQNISNRFKHLQGTSLENFYGPGLKFREKYRMITNLYTHEI